MPILGTIKFLTDRWGIVAGDDRLDRFFHRGSCADGVAFDTLHHADRVTFEEAPDGERGPRCQRVAPVRHP